jgi:hypothetical protein
MCVGAARWRATSRRSFMSQNPAGACELHDRAGACSRVRMRGCLYQLTLEEIELGEDPGPTPVDRTTAMCGED